MILSNTLAQDYIGPDIWKYTGSDISTEIIGWFENEQECMETALKFSIDNSIVESDEWANIILENGLDGAPIGSIPWNKGLTKETDERIRSYGQSVSHSTQGRITWNKGKSNPSAADSTSIS